MPELGEDSTLGVDEARVGGVAGHHEGMAAADHPRRGVVLAALRVPEAVVAITGLEIVEIACAERGATATSGRGGEPQTDPVVAPDPTRVVERQVGEQRYPFLLEQAVRD